MKDPVGKFFRQQKKSTRLAVIVSLIGVILFLLVATTFPFKDKLFSLLYPKPSSKAEEGINLTISGLNAANNMATLEGFNFSWNTGTFRLTDGAYAVMFVTLKDPGGSILDQHWLIGSQATEGLTFNGSYTFPAAGIATITVWETNKVDCINFTCNPSLAVHSSNSFAVPRIITTPTPTPTPPPPTPTPSPTPITTPSPPAQQYGSITGTVSSSQGGVVTGVKVTIKVGVINKTVYTNSFGVYNIPNLPPRTYSLTFQDKGYINQKTSADVTANTATVKDITLIKR